MGAGSTSSLDQLGPGCRSDVQPVVSGIGAAPRATSRSALDGMKAAGEWLAAGWVTGHGRSGSGRLKTKKPRRKAGPKNAKRRRFVVGDLSG